MSGLWYKNAIIYCVQVDLFMDGNGDGIGDFEGLTARLDYLAGLGVNCIWLLPFYPSPRRDAGFDVADYFGIDPQLGTLGDFVEFARAARDRGIRILTDLVMHHCSSEHPWFQSARRGPESPYFDYFVWTKTPAQDPDDAVFPEEQDGIWTYEPNVGAYYRHRFYEHEPDLNLLNPNVRNEVRKIMSFWLELGISGFRVDAAGFLVDRTGMPAAPDQDPYEIVRELRRSMSWARGDGVFLAEANVLPEEAPRFFGEGYGMHMLLNFWLNQHLFLALANATAEPLNRAFNELPPLVGMPQWANFLRNHDELDLGRLSADERESVYSKFAPEPSMRIYDRGIRRRLAPMLGDPKRVEMATSLLLSLPGTPVLYYGDEIAMGDDLNRPGRESVRVPMQWSDEANAGFSTAPSDRIRIAPLDSGPFGFRRSNVACLERDPRSLPNRTEHLIRTRKESPEIGNGTYSTISTNNEGVFAHSCRWEDRAVVAVHNFSSEECEVTLRFDEPAAGPLIELIGDQAYPEPKAEGQTHRLRLNGYGYRWFRLGKAQAAVQTHPIEALGAGAD